MSKYKKIDIGNFDEKDLFWSKLLIDSLKETTKFDKRERKLIEKFKKQRAKKKNQEYYFK